MKKISILAKSRRLHGLLADAVAMRECEIDPTFHGLSQTMIRGDMFMDAPEERGAPKLEVVNGVAQIQVCGTLAMGLDECEKMSGLCDVNDLDALLTQALADPRCRVIALLMDSPGGSIQGIYELGERIRAARAVKPVVAYSRSVCASAAYWLAAQASVIYAATTAVFGSIGIYAVLYDRSKMFEAAGVRPVLVKAGANKGAGIPGLPVTDEQAAAIQKRVDYVYGLFAAAVTAGRGGLVKAEDMDGSDWFAAEAAGRGLVDEILDSPAAVMAECQKLAR